MSARIQRHLRVLPSQVLLPDAGLFERDPDDDGGAHLPADGAPPDSLHTVGAVLAKALIDE